MRQDAATLALSPADSSMISAVISSWRRMRWRTVRSCSMRSMPSRGGHRLHARLVLRRESMQRGVAELGVQVLARHVRKQSLRGKLDQRRALALGSPEGRRIEGQEPDGPDLHRAGRAGHRECDVKLVEDLRPHGFVDRRRQPVRQPRDRLGRAPASAPAVWAHAAFARDSTAPWVPTRNRCPASSSAPSASSTRSLYPPTKPSSARRGRPNAASRTVQQPWLTRQEGRAGRGQSPFRARAHRRRPPRSDPAPGGCAPPRCRASH